MKFSKESIFTVLLITVMFSVLIYPTLSQAQIGGSYDLSWFSTDGGGGESNGGTYNLIGTLGQPDAGNTLSGGNYALTGGFWGSPDPQYVYLPLIVRS